MRPKLFKSLLSESNRRASKSSQDLMYNEPAHIALYDRLSGILNNKPIEYHDSPESSSS
jgi:hypothetical protein